MPESTWINECFRDRHWGGEVKQAGSVPSNAAAEHWGGLQLLRGSQDLLSFPLSILSGKIPFILNRGTGLVKPGLSGESQHSCVFTYL